MNPHHIKQFRKLLGKDELPSKLLKIYENVYHSVDRIGVGIINQQLLVCIAMYAGCIDHNPAKGRPKKNKGILSQLGQG